MILDTKEKLLALRPGKQLDQQIELLVFGRIREHPAEDYSRNLNDAMLVEEALAAAGWYLRLIRILGGWRGEFWRALPVKHGKLMGPDAQYIEEAYHEFSDCDEHDSGPGAAYAICRAAIAVVFAERTRRSGARETVE